MMYAHINNPEMPFRLPKVYAGIRNFDCLTDAQRAGYGVYPFVREPLNEGAMGYGPAHFDEASQTIVKPSLPADPEAALSSWRESAQVSRLQARLALIQHSLWDAVVAYFSSPSRTAADMAFWEDAQTWKRSDPVLAGAGAALGLTDEQIDELFQLAETFVNDR